VTVHLAGGKHQETINQADLKPGPLDLTGHKVSITQAGGKDHWDGTKVFAVTLQFQGDIANAVESVRFLDPKGNPIEANQSMSMTSMNIKQLEYHLDKQVPTATIELSLWDGLETVQVPLDLQASVGLSHDQELSRQASAPSHP